MWWVWLWQRFFCMWHASQYQVTEWSLWPNFKRIPAIAFLWIFHFDYFAFLSTLRFSFYCILSIFIRSLSTQFRNTYISKKSRRIIHSWYLSYLNLERGRNCSYELYCLWANNLIGMPNCNAVRSKITTGDDVQKQMPLPVLLKREFEVWKVPNCQSPYHLAISRLISFLVTFNGIICGVFEFSWTFFSTCQFH